jgi:predicted nucleic acid-binding protein
MSAPVVDASPLIFLAEGERLDLLRTVAESVVVPATVADEIQRRGSKDVTARALEETKWLRVKQPPDIPPSIQAWDLGPGESAVLAMAHSEPTREVIIDDLAGRRCAESFDIPVRGTLGVVLLAKQQGRIPKARPVVEQLRGAGMYLSDEVVEEALALVDE